MTKCPLLERNTVPEVNCHPERSEGPSFTHHSPKNIVILSKAKDLLLLFSFVIPKRSIHPTTQSLLFSHFDRRNAS